MRSSAARSTTCSSRSRPSGWRAPCSACRPAAGGHKPARARPRGEAPEPLTWLTASAGRETRLILVDDVAYFRADNKYTTVVTADGEALLRTPIRELLTVLDPATFKQIHR